MWQDLNYLGSGELVLTPGDPFGCTSSCISGSSNPCSWYLKKVFPSNPFLLWPPVKTKSFTALLGLVWQSQIINIFSSSSIKWKTFFGGNFSCLLLLDELSLPCSWCLSLADLKAGVWILINLIFNLTHQKAEVSNLEAFLPSRYSSWSTQFLSSAELLFSQLTFSCWKGNLLYLLYLLYSLYSRARWSRVTAPTCPPCCLLISPTEICFFFWPLMHKNRCWNRISAF